MRFSDFDSLTLGQQQILADALGVLAEAGTDPSLLPLKSRMAKVVSELKELTRERERIGREIGTIRDALDVLAHAPETPLVALLSEVLRGRLADMTRHLDESRPNELLDEKSYLRKAIEQAEAQGALALEMLAMLRGER